MNCLTVLLLSSLLGYTYACSCTQESDETKYCSENTHFGILAKVRNNGKSKKGDEYTKYKVKIFQTYKSSLKEGSKAFVYTAKTSCEVHLERDNFYILTGQFVNVTTKGNTKTVMTIQDCNYRERVIPPACHNPKTIVA